MTTTDNKPLSCTLAELGIPEDYASSRGLSPCPECSAPVETEPDVFGRMARMHPQTFLAWQTMRSAAQSEGITLQLVSAYRSVEYQTQLIKNKLAKGQTLAQILAVNALPGYSEHHSGYALDLGCPGYAHLEEEFEQSPAFRWLSDHAARYSFYLSYPRDNPWGVIYEPWHWCYRPAGSPHGEA